MYMRLAKFIACSGIASRRRAEKLIKEGRITINSQVVCDMGVKIDPDKDQIACDGQIITNNSNNIYILLNKPSGYISSVNDPQGRPTVLDLVRDIKERIYPVGRLDYDTQGLLLLSNDGEFTNLMIHPRYQMSKKYLALVKGEVSIKAVNQLEKGVKLEDGYTAPANVRILKKYTNETLLEIEIHEGRKRQIKRMCAAVGYPVLSLTRTAFSFLNLQGVALGEYRYLTPAEVKRLKLIAKKGMNQEKKTKRNIDQ